MAQRLVGGLKTALSGTHQAFKFAKYGRRTLAEVQYRFNHRADMAALVSRTASSLHSGRLVVFGVHCNKPVLLDKKVSGGFKNGRSVSLRYPPIHSSIKFFDSLPTGTKK
jgi:hypothetical protein